MGDKPNSSEFDPSDFLKGHPDWDRNWYAGPPGRSTWGDMMLGVFEPTEHDRLLDDLAAEYHRRTEAFDRTVCTGPISDDGILPATPQELAAIGRNALSVLGELVRRADGDREGLLRAIRRAA